MTNVVVTNEMVVASTKDCKDPRSGLTTIDLALLLARRQESFAAVAKMMVPEVILLTMVDGRLYAISW